MGLGAGSSLPLGLFFKVFGSQQVMLRSWLLVVLHLRYHFWQFSGNIWDVRG